MNMANIDIYKKIIKKYIQNKDFIKNKTVYMFGQVIIN